MPSDQPAKNGSSVSGEPVELSSGLFETPLYRHQARVVEDGIRVSAKPALQAVDKAGTIPSTSVTLPDMDAAQKYVTAFDRAIAHRGITADAGITNFGFRSNPDNPGTLQTVMKERVTNPRAGSGVVDFINGDKVLTADEDRVSAQGGRRIGFKGADDFAISTDQVYFHKAGQLAARAARDHMAHDAEVAMASATGHATLPLANAARMVGDFIQRDSRAEQLPTSRQADPKLPELGEHDRRFQLANGGYIQITGSPDQPAASQWAVHKWKNTGPGADDYQYDEVASGPLTVDSLEGMMKDQAKLGPEEGLAREMRRSTFVDDPSKLGKNVSRNQALPETATAGGLADEPANDLGISAEGVRGWQAQKAAGAKLAAEAPATAPPVKAL